jgi:lipopolysaccharide transport system permease protein
MVTALQNFFEAHDLLGQWTSRTLRARYQQSILGWLWAVVQPTTQALLFTVIFTWVVPVDTGAVPYVLFSYAALVPWMFLSVSLTDMANALVDNMDLVTKIYFPREVLPVAAMLARLVDLALGVGVLVVLALYYRLPIVSPGLVWFPVVLVVQVLLVAGLGLAAAAMNVFIRDVRSVLVLGIQIWFYASPILYPLDRVPAEVRPFYTFNPMVGILEGYRAILLHGQPPELYGLLTAALMSGTILVIGYAIFRTLELRFADVV